jgi:creatinine amidohydrolase
VHRSFVAFVLAGIVLVASTPAFGQNSVYLEELTWTEVRDAIKSGKTTAILATGGTEQNGPHAVLGKENFVVTYNAGEIAKRLGNALVAPTLAYVPEGNVDPPSGHMRYPGSITLPEEAYIQVLLWAGRSLKVNGFTDIVMIGNSGGNQAGQRAAVEQLNKEWATSGTRAHFIGTYYTAISSNQKPLGPFDAWVREQGEKDEDVGSHAGIKDTSTLMAVEAARFKKGQLVRWDKLMDKGGGASSGVTGNPLRASVAYGQKGLELQIEAAVKEIKAVTSRPK